MSSVKTKDYTEQGPEGLANLTKQDEAERQVLQAKLQASQEGGARVMQFDEEATPEQKAAEAKKKMDEIKGPRAEKPGGGTGEWSKKT